MTRTTRPRRSIRRVVTPAAKFWICKRTPFVTYEAMEVLGGSGYIEESIMPRLYREAPVNSIWEGSGNIMCLDVLRAMERTPNAVEVLRHELGEAKDARLKAFAERIEKRLAARDHDDESQARALVRDLMLALQGCATDRGTRRRACRTRFAHRGSTARGRGLRPVAARGLDLRGSPNAPVLRTKVCRIPRIPARPAQEIRRKRQACGEPGTPIV